MYVCMKKILLILVILLSSCTYCIGDFEDCTYIITSKEIGVCTGKTLYTVKKSKDGKIESPAKYFYDSRYKCEIGDTIVFCKK